jgi:hypothetical protein
MATTMFLRSIISCLIGLFMGTRLEKSLSFPYYFTLQVGAIWGIAISLLWELVIIARFYIDLPNNIQIPFSSLFNKNAVNDILVSISFSLVICIMLNYLFAYILWRNKLKIRKTS